jgi:hypothetical protein
MKPGGKKVGSLCLIGAIFLTGCASRTKGGRLAQVELPVATGRCLPTATIQDFRATSTTELRVRTGEKGWQYRIVLDRECRQLPVASRIGWTSQRGFICDYRHDAILVDGERCAIGRIEDYDAHPSEGASPGMSRP